MRLISFLNEGNKVEDDINQDKFNDLLNKQCKNNFSYILKNKPILYRGINAEISDYLFFSGTKTRKSSPDTTNHYTVLFSEFLSSWKDIPKRNKSLICTTNLRTANDFGKIYVVIPYDSSVKFASANSDDFWNIIRRSYEFKVLNMRSLTKLNKFLDLNCSATKTSIKKYLNSTIAEILEKNKDEKKQYIYLAHFVMGLLYLNIESDLFIYNKQSSTLSELLKKEYDKYYNKIKDIKIYDIYNKFLDPKNLNVDIIKFQEIQSLYNSEIWFSDKSLLISLDKFEKREYRWDY